MTFLGIVIGIRACLEALQEIPKSKKKGDNLDLGLENGESQKNQHERESGGHGAKEMRG